MEKNPSHVHAGALLRARGIPYSKIVDVRPYAITVVSRDRASLITCWLLYLEEREKCLVWVQPGLPAFP